MVRKGGLEPPCLSAPPPQDGVSANFTTSAHWWRKADYQYNKGGKAATGYWLTATGEGNTKIS